MTTGEWVASARSRLLAAGVEAAALEAQVLAGHVLLRDRSFVLSHPEAEFPSLAGEALLQRREGGEPLAYILGYREFFGRRFAVSPAVLIPRHETETLVSAAVELLGDRALSVLDLGTGSGCIAVTLALECPSARVVASDVSPEALEVARRNASDLGAPVEFVLGDGFEPLVGQSFDLIVTNPPYIGEAESLPVEVRSFEPSLALFAADEGLAFYRMLATSARHFLVDGGRLLMEVGYQQAGIVGELFREVGWSVEEVRHDLTGVERVVVVRYAFECGP